MLRATALAAALCVACVSSVHAAGLDAEKCKKINDAVADHGEATIIVWGPVYGYSEAQTKFAIKFCAIHFPKQK